jgi:L-seryl-tRNA(Ser) seleniumtransferase
VGAVGEPTVPSHVAAGADAVIFSGDKLLGGPQCGIICGESAAIEKIRRHPLARALRADKMTLAALAATLEAYRDADNRFAQARREIPTLAALCEEEGEVKKRAQKLQRWLAQSQARGAGLAAAGPRWRMEVRASRAQAGAGSLPTRDLPSWSLVLIPPGAPASAGAPEAAGTVGGEVGGTVGEAARRLRRGGLWGRVESGALWLDARTLRDGDVDEVVRAVSAFFTSLSLERERKNLEARGNT